MKTTAIAAVLALAGCASGAPYVTEAQNFWNQHQGDVAPLLAKNASLTDRAGKLPTDLAGVSALVSGLGGNKKTLDTLQADLSGEPAKVQAAVDAGKLTDAKAALDQGKDAAGPRLGAAKDELAKLETQVADLELKAAAAEATKKAPAPAPAPARFAKDLSTGFKIDGNLDGTEARLIAFIEDPSKKVDKDTWFNFDRLEFASGKNELDMAKSKTQLANIVEILKAFPKVSLKIGGYTDNVGKPAANQKLSTDRAKNVMADLVKAGADAKRLASEGYGDKYPECAANDTEACKQKNRRIALRVTAK